MNGTPVVVPWFGPDDYQSILKLFPEGHPARLCPYENWMNNTFRDETRLRHDGFAPLRVYVSFAAYKGWLERKGYALTGERIGEFAKCIECKVTDSPHFGMIYHGDRLPPPKL